MPSHPRNGDARLACKEIDDDHGELLRLIEDIKNEIEAGRTDALVRSLEDFQGKVKAHFRREEEIMRLYAYPYYDGHKLLHGDLLETLEDRISTCRAEEPVKVTLQVFSHLTNELQHCVAEDRHLTTYLREL